MKVGLVYTSTTPELIELVESEVEKQLGENIEIVSYSDSSILEEVIEKGYVNSSATSKLIKMYMDANLDNADVILNICSSVGEVADKAQDIAKFTGIPIVRIDEDMCREAVILGKKIGVMATLNSTLDPTKNTIRRVAREIDREVEIVDCLVDGAFGLNQEDFKKRMLEKAAEIENKVDVILFAQGSMAYCEEEISKSYNKTVVSSPRFGAIAVKNALVKKGLI